VLRSFNHKIALMAALSCTAIVGVSSCAKQPSLGNLEGRVTFQGKPVTEGYVLVSSAGTGVHLAAELDTSGKYATRTAEGIGVPPGTYEMAVLPPSLPIPNTVNPGLIVEKPYPMIPIRYRSPQSSGIQATVREGTNEPFNIDMQP
jgi:hypothetical protein